MTNKIVVIIDGDPQEVIEINDFRIKHKDLRKLYESVDIAEKLGTDYADNELFISTQTGIWTVSETSMYRHWIVPIDGIRKITIVANSNVAQHYSLFASYNTPTAGNAPDYATGYSNVVRVAEGTARDIVVPADAKYLYLNTGNNGAAKAAHVYLTGVGITEHTGDGTGFVKDDGTVDDTEYQQALPEIAGNGGKVLAVTSGGDDLEWVPQSGGTTLPAYTGNAGKKLAVNAAEDGVEWVPDTGGYNLDAGIDLEMAQSYVPDGYKEQTYVYNSASTRLNTGVVLSEDDVVMEIKVRPSTGSWYIFQSRNSSNQVAGISGASSGAKINANFCGTTVTSNITRTTSDWYVVRMIAKNGVLTLYVKDETAGTEDTVTSTYTYTQQTLSVYIWGNNQGNTVSQNNRVEYAYIKVGGKKLMHYIPAVRMSDSKAGFYDLVSKSFKEATSGTANAGGDATAHNVLNFVNDTGYAVLPPHTNADAEKVLSIDNTGKYEWRALGQGGQVNADWNATSGVAQILNKPTIPSLPKELGIAYGLCSDNIEDNPSNPFEVAMQSGYEPKDGGMIAINFTNPLPAGRSLSINNQTFSIFYRNSAVGNGLIKSNDTVLFATFHNNSGWNCLLLDNDRWNISPDDIEAIPNTLHDLDDTNLFNPAQFDKLVYDVPSRKWINRPADTLLCTATITQVGNATAYNLDYSPRDIYTALLKGVDVIVVPNTTVQNHGGILFYYHCSSVYKYDDSNEPPAQYIEFSAGNRAGVCGRLVTELLTSENWDSTETKWYESSFDATEFGTSSRDIITPADGTSSINILVTDHSSGEHNYLIDNSSNSIDVSVQVNIPPFYQSMIEMEYYYPDGQNTMTVAAGAIAQITARRYVKKENNVTKYYCVVTRQDMQTGTLQFT